MSCVVEWILAFCGIYPSDPSRPFSGESKSKTNCKTCVPKEFLVIWFIVTVLAFLGLDYVSRTPYKSTSINQRDSSVFFDQESNLKKGDVKLVIYDFDQTITSIHLYHEVYDREVDQEVALSKLSDQRLLEIFGGNDRLKALREHFSKLKEHQIEVAILSYGYVGVIKAALQRMKLFDSHFAESVIIGTDSKELDIAKGSKAQCILNVFGRNLKSEQIIFVDDDKHNIAEAEQYQTNGQTVRVCHTVLVYPRSGMNKKQMKNIEEIAGITEDHQPDPSDEGQEAAPPATTENQ